MVQMLRPWQTILDIDFSCDTAVYDQIAEGIIAEIRKGRLKPGAALPGSRVLAEAVGVNRKTVVLAYEALLAEGWLETEEKKGTFVARQLPVIKKQPSGVADPFAFNDHASIAPVPAGAPSGLIIFNDGLPDVRLAPMGELASAYKRIFQQKARWCRLGYGHEQGEEKLRVALADMLAHKRGVSTDRERICLTRGSQMALYLTAHTLVSPGDVVVLESPGYLPAWQTFREAGAELVALNVDDKGLMVEKLEKICTTKKVKAVYVTPHHQFPTTVSMKMDRRLRLLELSNRYGFAVVEDDYDHEYHFEAKSLLPLAGQEQAVNVIYISSLSKLVAPAVRLGYVSGPPAFIASLARLRGIIDRQGDVIMELALAELMESGAVNRHARRAHQVYAERWAHMDECLNEYLSGYVSYRKPEGGLAYWLELRQPADMSGFRQRLQSKGVSVIPTEHFAFDGNPLHALRLGFASLTLAELEEGIRIIAAQLKKEKRSGRG